MIGLTLAHDRATAYWGDYRQAARSQYWMLAVMVAFTCFGLYLLSVANGESGEGLTAEVDGRSWRCCRSPTSATTSGSLYLPPVLIVRRLDRPDALSERRRRARRTEKRGRRT